ncbi:MAG: TolC family protein [bacterium]|nr:TolC family protein [bacterium]MDD5354611.1 TolC family protein [bacterium]MDD5755654.1 TolC family protein [bacterium]
MNFNKYLISLIILVLVAGFVGSAGKVQAQQRSLSLDECIKTALANNKQLLLFQEKTNNARAKKIEAAGSYWPNISAMGAYIYNHKINMVNFAGTELPLGARDSYLGKLSLTQPLFMGGKIYQSNRQADIGMQLVNWDYLKQRDDLLYQVKQSFYTVLLAQQMVRINQEAYEVVAAHLKVSHALYNEGKMSNYDVSRVKVQLANQKTSLIKAQNNLKINVDALINILGLEPAQEIEFVGQLDYVEKSVQDYETGLNQALGKRIEVRQLLLQEEAANSLVLLAQSGHWPNLLLNSVASRQNSSGFGADLAWTNSWTTTVSLTIPLFEGFATKARIDQAKSQKEQVRLTKDQLIDSIKIEVKQAYFTLAQAKDNIAGQGENVDTAKDNLRIAQERYKLGLMSDIEVRDAELTLTQAEINYYQATYEYIMAQAKVEKVIGETLK